MLLTWVTSWLQLADLFRCLVLQSQTAIYSLLSYSAIVTITTPVICIIPSDGVKEWKLWHPIQKIWIRVLARVNLITFIGGCCYIQGWSIWNKRFAKLGEYFSIILGFLASNCRHMAFESLFTLLFKGLCRFDEIWNAMAMLANNSNLKLHERHCSRPLVKCPRRPKVTPHYFLENSKTYASNVCLSYPQDVCFISLNSCCPLINRTLCELGLAWIPPQLQVSSL